MSAIMALSATPPKPQGKEPVPEATVKIKLGKLKNGRAEIFSKVPVFGTLKPYNPNLLAGFLIPSFAAGAGLSLVLASTRNWLPALGLAAMAALILIAASSVAANPLRLPNTELVPVSFSDLTGWKEDDHAAAFAGGAHRLRAGAALL